MAWLLFSLIVAVVLVLSLVAALSSLFGRSQSIADDIAQAPPVFHRREQPLVIAHGDERGNGLRPGNTLDYLRHMQGLGVDALELDLHLTADGQLVMIHDHRLERITDGRGLVREHTLEALKVLRVGESWSPDGGETFPFRDHPLSLSSIDEVLAESGDLPLVIELKDKSPLAAQAMCRAARLAAATDRLVVSSFHQSVIDEFRRICPEVSTGAAFADALKLYAGQLLGLDRWMQPCYRSMQLPMHHFGLPVVTRGLLNAAHRFGIHVAVWTVNTEEEMQQYLERGVDGIVTDRPDRLLELLERAGGR